jgi:UDP-N-acetylmuramoyl-tripeptide--D-alanyl-D-alanine ligase
MQKLFDKILSIKNKYKSNIVFDTRYLKKNDIFIGIKSLKNDGSLFFQDAINKKASLVIINNPNAYHQNIFQIVNINKFILNFCKFLLSQYKGRIIAITGSVGKTTIKENIFNILKKNNFLVSKSYKNFNNKLGLQFSIMNMKLNSNFSIFELGINAPHEMKSLINILHPHYCLITGIENSHIGNFKNFSSLVNNKLQIFQSKNLIKGLINFSHPKPDLEKKIKSSTEIINLDNLDVLVTKKNKYLLNFKHKGYKYNIESDLNGIYIDTAIISYLFLKKFIKKFHSENFFYAKSIIDSRGKVIYKNFNGKNIKIFDHSYNSSPYSLKKHLFFFNQKKISKKLCIIGSMKELGSNSSNYHIEILDTISSYKLLKYIFIGDEFFKLKNMYKNYKFYKSYKDYTKIMNRDLSNFKNIFVMGSRSNQLEKIIEKI